MLSLDTVSQRLPMSLHVSHSVHACVAAGPRLIGQASRDHLTHICRGKEGGGGGGGGGKACGKAFPAND